MSYMEAIYAAGILNVTAAAHAKRREAEGLPLMASDLSQALLQAAYTDDRLRGLPYALVLDSLSLVVANHCPDEVEDAMREWFGGGGPDAAP